jgi:uncharacterized SAM-binding protein YcdF (DUF218 family)
MTQTAVASPNSKNSIFQWFQAALICSGLLIALPVAVTRALFGKSAMEKYLTATVQPMFLLCFTLLCLGFVLFRREQRGAAIFVWLIVASVWLISCGLVRDEIYRRWEQRIPFTSLEELKPYEYVVVLGGGTGIRPDGFPQFNEPGDRVALAARLYHRGLAKHLVTTGVTMQMTGSFNGGFQESDTPAYQTAVLWQELGVPADVVEKLGGENTISEMKELAQHTEWWQDKRCAIITSAFHMPRAMRLAKKMGIQADPIPSHFRSPSKNQPITPEDFLPKADHLSDVHYLFKEWSAGLVGR